MMQCNPASLPCDPKWDISPAGEGEERLSEIETQRNIGSLRFITVLSCTKLHLSFLHWHELCIHQLRATKQL